MSTGNPASVLLLINGICMVILPNFFFHSYAICTKTKFSIRLCLNINSVMMDNKPTLRVILSTDKTLEGLHRDNVDGIFI